MRGKTDEIVFRCPNCNGEVKIKEHDWKDDGENSAFCPGCRTGIVVYLKKRKELRFGITWLKEKSPDSWSWSNEKDLAKMKKG